MQLSCEVSWTQKATCNYRNQRYTIESTGIYDILILSLKLPKLGDRSPDNKLTTKTECHNGVDEGGVSYYLIHCIKSANFVQIVFTEIKSLVLKLK